MKLIRPTGYNCHPNNSPLGPLSTWALTTKDDYKPKTTFQVTLLNR